MTEIVNFLEDYTLPAIIAFGGIIFLLLAFIGNNDTSLEAKPKRKVWAIIVGVVLICCSMCTYGASAVYRIGASTPTPEVPTITVSDTTAQPVAEPLSKATRIDLDQGGIFKLSYLRDGKTWAIETPSGVYFYSTDTFHIRAFQKDKGSEKILAVSPDGRTIATVSTSSNMITLWDADNGQKLKTLETKTERVSCASFSPDGHALASSLLEGIIEIWDIDKGEKQRILYDGHTTSTNDILFFPDEHTLASHDDYEIIVWDLLKEEKIHTLGGPKAMISHIALSPDGRTLANGSWDGTIVFWDIASGTKIKKFDSQSDGVLVVAFSPDGRTIAGGLRDGPIIIWDIASGEKLQTLEGHENWVMSLAFSPDGDTLVSGSLDEKILIWDLNHK